jgi:hypothetical protein
MKKPRILIACLAVSLLIVPASVYPWGSAVHAYIASQLKPGNVNVCYGSLAPDMFNYAFEVGALKDVMYDQFHNYPQLLWNPSGTTVARSLAYGFMNHREDDQTAHYGGVQFGKKDGYVIVKAKVLDDILASKFPEYAAIKAAYPALSLSIAHNIVENSIDILLKRMDPQVGIKLMQAAGLRDATFPSMVIATYAGGDPALSGIISAVELAFKTLMYNYGGLFAIYDEQGIIDGLSAQMAAFAPVFLPPGIELPYDLAYQIVRTGTVKGMDICKGTFFKEVKLTVEQARQNLSGYNIN